MINTANIQQAANDFQQLLLLPVQTKMTYEQLVLWLTNKVSVLLKDDFSALIQLLYRLDISEEKLRYLLQQNKGEIGATIIAKQMIERQLQKIETRKMFLKKEDDIPEDEKW